MRLCKRPPASKTHLETAELVMLQTIHGLENLAAPLQNTAVAIGVFDGVHRGHQEILRQTAREARSLGLTPVALTFDIHPSALFAPDHAPLNIGTLSQRAHWMDTLGGGMALMVVARFTPVFAALSPASFVADVLEGQLGAKHILVGADFCYGKGRAGTVTTLLGAGARQGFAVTVVPPILRHGVRVSSTQVRILVAEGNIPAAADLLGHPFMVQGNVVPGKQLGRTLGYPTANLQPLLARQALPAHGVYAARAHLHDGRIVSAAVSVGVNPTTDMDNARKIEAFLMDGFAEDIYGQAFALEFVAKVRDEARFDSLDALVTQMGRDVAQINSLLNPE